MGRTAADDVYSSVEKGQHLQAFRLVLPGAMPRPVFSVGRLQRGPVGRTGHYAGRGTLPLGPARSADWASRVPLF